MDPKTVRNVSGASVRRSRKYQQRGAARGVAGRAAGESGTATTVHVFKSPKRKREDSESRSRVTRLLMQENSALDLRGSFDGLDLSGKRRNFDKLNTRGYDLADPMSPMSMLKEDDMDRPPRHKHRFDPSMSPAADAAEDGSPLLTSRSAGSDRSGNLSVNMSTSPYETSPAATISPATTAYNNSLLLASGGGSCDRHRRANRFQDSLFNSSGNRKMATGHYAGLRVEGHAAMPRRNSDSGAVVPKFRVNSGARRRGFSGGNSGRRGAQSSPGTSRKSRQLGATPAGLLDYNSFKGGIADIDADHHSSKYDDDDDDAIFEADGDGSPSSLGSMSARSIGSPTSSYSGRDIRSPPPLIALRTPFRPVWRGPTPQTGDERILGSPPSPSETMLGASKIGDENEESLFKPPETRGRYRANSSGDLNDSAEGLDDSVNSSHDRSVDTSGSMSARGRPTPTMDANNTSVGSSRPTPDMEAFSATPSRDKGPQCPPTPVRTPTWAHSSAGLAGATPGALERRSSLDGTKMLFASGSFDQEAAVSSEDFEKIKRLGAGTSSEVFKCRSISDGKLYALKISKRQFRSKRDRENYLTEVQIFKRLGYACEHTLHYHRAWQEQGHFYIQSEYCARGNLKNFLDDIAVPLPEDAIWGFVVDICAGLVHIHTHNLVHLDIKPANIFITSDGKLKIGDFGMVTEVGSSEDGREGDSVYMAPELLNNLAIKSPAADIFSFGIMLWEMLFSRDPPQDGDMWHNFRADKIPRPGGQEGSSDELFEFVRSCLQRDPAKRPTARSILKMPRVVAASQEINQFVLTAPKKKKTLRFPPHLQLGRSDSFTSASVMRPGITMTPGGNSAHALPFDMEEIVRQREGLCTPKDQPVHPSWS